jgi:hypothetical protein
VWSGTIDGFDRLPNEPYKWGYIGRMSWTSRNQKMNFIIDGADAYDQPPTYPPPSAQDLPVGVPGSGFLPRRPNPFYNKSRRGYLLDLLTCKWTDKLTQALEVDTVWEPQTLATGRIRMLLTRRPITAS